MNIFFNIGIIDSISKLLYYCIFLKVMDYFYLHYLSYSNAFFYLYTFTYFKITIDLNMIRINIKFLITHLLLRIEFLKINSNHFCFSL